MNNTDLDKKIAVLKGCFINEEGKNYCSCKGTPHGYCRNDYAPPYFYEWSSKLEHAWTLFEEMRGFKIRNNKPTFNTKENPKWTVYDKDDLSIGIWASGDTAAEAICKAWIKWYILNNIKE